MCLSALVTLGDQIQGVVSGFESISAGLMTICFVCCFLFCAHLDNADRRFLLWVGSAVKAALILIVAGSCSLFDLEQPGGIGYLLFVPVCLFAVAWTLSATIQVTVIPDVVSVGRRGALSSLVSWACPAGLLAGFLLALVLLPGPGLVASAVASCVLSALLLRALPEAVSVPGVERVLPKGAEGSAEPTVEPGFRSGLNYFFRRRGLLTLSFFDVLFWSSAVLLFVLSDWHEILNSNRAGEVHNFALKFGILGAGMLCGHVAMGLLCRLVSPLFTYPVSLVLAGVGMTTVLTDDWGLTLAGCSMLFLVGVGGGSLLGRVSDDFLQVTRPEMRGRVTAIRFALRAGVMAVTLCVLAMQEDPALRETLIGNYPTALCWAAIPAFAFAWVVDAGIYAGRGVVVYSGLQERISFRVARFMSLVIAKTYFRLTVIGADKVPDEGPVILAANHGSFLDPILMGVSMKRSVQYLMHAEYYHSLGHPFFRLMMTVPVDESSQTRALRTLGQALEQGIQVGIFPEGTVSMDGELQKPQAGVIFLGKRSGAPIYPVAIKGNVRAFRRQYKFPRPYKITVVVGEPLTVPKNAKREEVAELADGLMAQLAETLEMKPPPKLVDE